MLAYAFQILKNQGYASCSTEKFANTADLLSAILVKSVNIQLKRGLGRTYIENTGPLSCLKGKIDVNESIKGQTIIKHQLICTYDDFSVNSYTLGFNLSCNALFNSLVPNIPFLVGVKTCILWKKS